MDYSTHVAWHYVRLIGVVKSNKRGRLGEPLMGHEGAKRFLSNSGAIRTIAESIWYVVDPKPPTAEAEIHG